MEQPESKQRRLPDAAQQAAFFRQLDEEWEQLRREYASQPAAVPTEEDIAAFRVILDEHDALVAELQEWWKEKTMSGNRK